MARPKTCKYNVRSWSKHCHTMLKRRHRTGKSMCSGMSSTILSWRILRNMGTNDSIQEKSTSPLKWHKIWEVVITIVRAHQDKYENNFNVVVIFLISTSTSKDQHQVLGWHLSHKQHKTSSAHDIFNWCLSCRNTAEKSATQHSWCSDSNCMNPSLRLCS